MEIKDVQKSRRHERRTYRINIRITESQNAFIKKNNLSVTKILDVALKQLGYVAPKPSEINTNYNDKKSKFNKVNYKRQ